jgi:hypothetical protein
MDWVVLVGTVSAVIGTIAAIVAAVFAARGDFFGRNQAKLNTAARQRDIRPRPKERWLGSRGGGLAFFNNGGSAEHVVWVGVSESSLFAAYATFPQHFEGYVPCSASDLGPLPAESPLANKTETVLLVAQDIDGSWWASRNSSLVNGSIKDYVAARLAELGLSAAAGRVFEVGQLT